LICFVDTVLYAPINCPIGFIVVAATVGAGNVGAVREPPLRFIRDAKEIAGIHFAICHY